MSYLVCGRREQADKYASAKSLGEWGLAASLLADDIKDIYDIIKAGEDSQQYFWAVVVVIGLSLVLQCLALAFALVLYFHRYPTKLVPSGVEMTPAPSGDVNPEGNTSTDTPDVHIEGTAENTKKEKPPRYLQMLNDGLALMALILAILHVLKNGLKSGVVHAVDTE